MRRSFFSLVRAPVHRPLARRCLSQNKPNSPRPLPKSNEQADVRGRFDRFIERVPRFLQPTVNGLRQAPLSHVAAFLVLHELTAVIPLFGLAGAFHYWRWLPPYFAEGAWISAGVEKFGRYFRKKGWISERDEKIVEEQAKQGKARSFEKQNVSKWFHRGEDATRWVVEFATAYALVKVLLPLRIVLSVWGSPWFARFAVIPIGNATRSVFRRKT